MLRRLSSKATRRVDAIETQAFLQRIDDVAQIVGAAEEIGVVGELINTQVSYDILPGKQLRPVGAILMQLARFTIG